MSNLIDHARYELMKAGYTGDSTDELDRSIWYSTMNIVQSFANVGHSGSSAWAHIAMIERLLRFEALTPVTDDPAEWNDVSDFMGKVVWQNRRNGSFFSEDGGKTYYSVDELRRGWKAKIFGRTGKIYTSARRDKVGA